MAGIMVSAATGVINSLLEKLTKLLGDEYKLLKGVKQDIAFLKYELSSMNALLEKLADTEVLDPQQKEWRNQVREMSYDIEDCIDKYMYQIDHEPEKPSGIMGFILSYVDKVRKLAVRPEIVEEIQLLKARIIDVGHRRKRYKLDIGDNSGITNIVPIDPRLPALYAEASSLVGIDVPRDELIKFLIDGEQQLIVVSIVGFGGLGKTTLANQIYQKVGKQFDCWAFVSVSQNPDTRVILWNMLCEFKKQGPVGPPPGQVEWLINALRDFLENKRYFIVIDDIWSTQAFKIIKCALPENICGSRILVTTRIATVAKSCCSRHRDVYELRPLSKVHSESLFFRRVFGSDNGCPPQLKEVSTAIVRKCGGLPLAIITMASLLTNKSQAREEWVMVLSSIGSGLEKSSDVDEMKKILSLSYIDLSQQLRTCLLYLSLFPEDYVIQKDRLVGMWVAEGFVKPDDGRDLREKGECYFNELINRSMIQPVNIEYDGQTKACRVHDMILDLITSKADEENFITFLRDQSHKLMPQNKIRRLSLGCHGQENVSVISSMVTAHVRSLGIFGESMEMPRIPELPALRVLDMGSSQFENCDFGNIGKLFQLRYLRIGQCEINRIPEEIGELQYLETLVLKCSRIRELPASISKLRQLKWLHANGANLPDGLGSLQSLQELTGVMVSNDSSINPLQELGSLSKLRFLELCWYISESCSDKMAYTDILASSLGKLVCSNLRYLQVCRRGSRTPDVPLDSWSSPCDLLRELNIIACSLQGIPDWMAILANLTKLSIKVSEVTQDMFNILGNLPSLLYLCLESTQQRVADHPKERLIVCNNVFKILKVFNVWGWKVTLMFEAGAMPKLEELMIEIGAREMQSSCDDPCFGIHHLCALKDIRVKVDCRGARVGEVEAWEAAIRNAATLLPRHPTSRFFKIGSAAATSSAARSLSNLSTQ